MTGRANLSDFGLRSWVRLKEAEFTCLGPCLVVSWKRQTWRLVWTTPSPCLSPPSGTDTKEEVVGQVESQTKDPTMDNRRSPISIPSLVTSPSQEIRNPYQKGGAFNIEPWARSFCVPVMFSCPEELASQTRDLTAAKKGKNLYAMSNDQWSLTSPSQEARNPYNKEGVFNSYVC